MQRKKPRLLFVLIGLVIIVLILYCWWVLVRSSGLHLFPKSEKSPGEWTLKLLNNPTCQLPCWEKIVPGETLIKNSPTLIGVVQGAKIITYPMNAEGSGIIQMQWSLDSDSNTPDYAEANALLTDGIIYTIVLGVNENKKLSIDKVMKAFGDPEYLHVYYCNSKSCLFRLLYPRLGLIIEVPLRDSGDKATISSNAAVSNFVLIPVGIDGYENHLIGRGSMSLSTPIMTWKGYGQYDYKGNFEP
jgi:hypothetical protein